MPEDVIDPVVAAAAAAAAEAKPDPRDAEIESLRARAAESEEAARFWSERAKAAKPAEAQTHVPGEEEDTDDDVLGVLATGGAKAFDKAIAKRGFIKAADVEKMVGAKAAEMIREQAVMARYPDLKDKSSEFFKETAKQYNSLKSEGVSGSIAAELAAERAELVLIRTGKIKVETAADKSKRESAEERRLRADAQAPERGRRHTQAEEDDETLTADQKRICDAMGVKYEDYAKEAKAGVAMSGRSR